MLGVNHMLFVHMKVKGVVRVRRVVRVAAQRFFPADDLANVFNQCLAFGQVLHGKHALAMHAGATRLDAAAGRRGGWGGRDRRKSRGPIFGHD